MNSARFIPLVVVMPMLLIQGVALGGTPSMLPVAAAMRRMVSSNARIAGAVTMVVSQDAVPHVDSCGFSDVAARRPMEPDSLFWIASMTKPVTATAILMLQDDGKLRVTDPVAKYLPEFARLKTPAGRSADLTIVQLLTHTSGLGRRPRTCGATGKDARGPGATLVGGTDAI
ncbi:MAG: serine hydrolase domain-containing protein [Verrucomicrobiota bacterium]